MKETNILAARLSAGGVAPIPLLLRETGKFLTGSVLSEETIAEACSIAETEVSPISDIRGTKEYKISLLKAQIRAHLTRGLSI